MKRVRTVLLIGLLIFPTTAIFSQVDSTTIYYRGIEDRELNTICSLADIQIQKIFSKDTLLRGKVFNIIIKEYKKGKICSEQNFNYKAEEKRIPMVVNGQPMTYIIDYTDKTGFGQSTDSLTVTFAGVWNKNKFKLHIEYPGLGSKKVLKGKNNYSLRPANSCSDNEIRVPINAEYPILVYTPPFDTGTDLLSYCLLGEENVLDWYDKFKVKHYYVIYLEIR